MRRRDFITLVAGTAALWPLSAGAQSNRMRRIAVMAGQGETDPDGQARYGAFREGLAKLGWTEGRNFQMETRWLESSYSTLGKSVDELLRFAPDIIMTNGTQQLAAFQRATKTIPIVFAQVSDPVGGGFAASVTRPGGNITGFTDYEYGFAVKWLELLREIVPGVQHVAVAFDNNNFLSFKFLPHIEAAGKSLGVTVTHVALRAAEEIDAAIDAFGGGPNRGLIVLAGVLTLGQRDKIIARASRHRLPAIYPYRTFALSGGLTSYGVDHLDMFRGAATYVDRILKGEKPADLPIQFATRFEFVVNLKTARDIGLTMPTSVLLRASDVIE